MSGWVQAFSSIQKGVQKLDLPGASNKARYYSKAAKGFANLAQTIKEQTGNEIDVTELPEDYLALERRVDALRQAHQSLLKITKAYENEQYDYPTQLNESITEISQNIGHSVSFWAASATKGTNLPQPGVVEKPPQHHKTLSHALSRATADGAVTLKEAQQSDALSKALQSVAVAQDAVGNARLEQDASVGKDANAIWQATLTQINAAMKARANVKSARLSLDATRSRHKNATGTRAEQSRLEIEQAEEHLVNATEEAITLMRAVLESPSSLTGLVNLIKAQQAYHAKAAETLQGIIPDLEETATRAESEYRKTRSS